MEQSQTLVPLSEVLEIAGSDRNSFNYWKRIGILSTEFASTTAGKKRGLTRENALEVAFLAATIAVGFSPRKAVRFVKAFIELEAVDALPPYITTSPLYAGPDEYFAVRGQDDDVNLHTMALEVSAAVKGINRDEFDDMVEAGLFEARISVFCVLYLDNIVRRINVLFGTPDRRPLNRGTRYRATFPATAIFGKWLDL